MRDRRWAVLAVLCASLLLVAMDATILNVALPSLIDDIRPDAIEQLWIIDVYGLVLGGLLVTAGAVGDRWGRRRLFLAGFVMFGVASVVAATAHGPVQLITGRVLLGVGGAMVMPSTLSLIRNVFTDERERGLAIGIWASVAGAGAAIGPIIGGVLVQAYGWAAAFWVNVPVVLVTVAVGVVLLPESKAPGSGPLDWFGGALSVVGTMVFVWGVKHLVGDGFSALSPIAVLAGLGLLVVFTRRQLRLPDPLLDVRLFRSRPFVAAAVATLVAMMAIGCALYLLSLWLQYVQALSPLGAGVRMLPAALATLFSALATPWLVRRIGVRAVLGIGLGALALGFAVIAFAPTPLGYPVVALTLVSFGLGDGLAITAAAAVMVSAAPPERAGGAAAVEETCYELGIGFGVALLGSLAALAYRGGVGGLDLHGDELATARESIGGAAEIASQLGGPAGARVLSTARGAFVDALVTTSTVSAVLAIVAVALTLWLVPPGFRATSAH
ncbi:MFS transporter [Solihabitans fulvus]|uniref:MFS transporter n=1 Tax=Solihabitans fulvus TaxID=1892852 RepID=A0A5B2XGP6_9PSEU|nr:MFS transporter [Solihabitans fulvus]KAA2262957.1 MFS transporter [Solihabitans fulvus]